MRTKQIVALLIAGVCGLSLVLAPLAYADPPESEKKASSKEEGKESAGAAEEKKADEVWEEGLEEDMAGQSTTVQDETVK